MLAFTTKTRDYDRELLAQWQSGDGDCGRELFSRYFHQLHRFFSNKCREPEEMVQATFMALLRAKDQFAGRSSFRTYLFTIARHELYRHLRTLKRERDFDPVVSSIAEVATSIGAKLVKSEEQRRLCTALRTLPLEQQTLLELHYWEDVDAVALAEIFDTQPATMRMRLHRARAALKEALLAGPAAASGVENLETWARAAR